MSEDDFQIGFEFRSKRYADAESGLRAFASALGAGVEKATPALRRELEAYLHAVAQAMAQRHGTPWPAGTSDKTLSRRSGKLVASILGSVTVTGSTLATVTGSIGAPGVPYARIHETGGTRGPDPGEEWVFIPLPAALNSDGTPKKQSWREWDKTFQKVSKNGNRLVFRREGKALVPLYVLKPSVEIKPRLGLRKTLESQLPYFVERAMDAMLRELRTP